MQFRPEPVDLQEVVGEVRDILRSLAGTKRITIAIEIDASLSQIVADPAKLKQILYNYLSNALKFTADGGRVTVRMVPEGVDRFRLEVKDTGVGIEAAHMKRLFVEFQQLDASASKKHPGTGLGLALTKRIVEAQGGYVGVRSTLGKGSTFVAVLPCKAEHIRAAGLPDPGGADRMADAMLAAHIAEQQRQLRTLPEAEYHRPPQRA
jgi:signal transduction histidine kinase